MPMQNIDSPFTTVPPYSTSLPLYITVSPIRGARNLPTLSEIDGRPPAPTKLSRFMTLFHSPVSVPFSSALMQWPATARLKGHALTSHRSLSCGNPLVSLEGWRTLTPNDFQILWLLARFLANNGPAASKAPPSRHDYDYYPHHCLFTRIISPHLPSPPTRRTCHKAVEASGVSQATPK